MDDRSAALVNALMRTFKSAIIQAAREQGFGVLSFDEAMLALDSKTANSLHDAYRKQMQAIQRTTAGDNRESD